MLNLHSPYFTPGEPLCIRPCAIDQPQALMQLRSLGRDGYGAHCELIAKDGTSRRLAGAPSAQQGVFMAVVPIFGTMFQHSNPFGFVSTAEVLGRLDQLDQTPAVGTIVLEINSPGGQVYGTSELAAKVHTIAKGNRTRIVAVVNSEMASAALWVGTAAERVDITTGGQAGSLGVVALHEDISGTEAKAGRKTTVIAVPRAKADESPFSPLSDTARASIEASVAKTYGRFVADVARFRGVSKEYAEVRFGGGGMLSARKAVGARLVDGVLTKQQVVARELASLASTQSTTRRTAAAGRNRLAAMGLLGDE